jgi:hypothetical protein
MEGAQVIELPQDYDLPTLLRAWAIRLDTMERKAEQDDERMGDRLDSMERRLEDGDSRMGKIEVAVRTNAEATSRIEKNTGDLVEAFQSLRGGFKVLEFVGKLAKPLAGIIALATATYVAWKGR